MAQNTNIALTLSAWAGIVIKNWLDKIEKLGVYDTRALINSFVHQIISHSGGDVSRIEFAFNYYGKFADMGVGKGVTLADAGISNRKPRPWYSPTFLAEIGKLSDLLAKKYARKGQLTVLELTDLIND